MESILVGVIVGIAIIWAIYGAVKAIFGKPKSGCDNCDGGCGGCNK